MWSGSTATRMQPKSKCELRRVPVLLLQKKRPSLRRIVENPAPANQTGPLPRLYSLTLFYHALRISISTSRHLSTKSLSVSAHNSAAGPHWKARFAQQPSYSWHTPEAHLRRCRERVMVSTVPPAIGPWRCTASIGGETPCTSSLDAGQVALRWAWRVQPQRERPLTVYTPCQWHSSCECVRTTVRV